MPARPRLQLPALGAFLVPRPTASAGPALLLRTYAAQPQKKPAGTKKTRAARSHFRPVDVSTVDQFSLVDAMRYIRAFEVGCDPVAAKYELHVKLRSQKSGPTIKSRIRLPKPVKTDMRIAVIAEGKHAAAARAAGAVMVGTEEVFEKVGGSGIPLHPAAARGGMAIGRWVLMPGVRAASAVDPRRRNQL